MYALNRDEGCKALVRAVAVALSAAAPMTQTQADEYLVSDLAQLQTAITAANAHPDAAAIIRVTADIPGSASLPTPTKPMTIDTQGYTVTSLTFIPTTDQTLTLTGTFVGAPGGRGLWVTSGTVRARVVNDASITGGPAVRLRAPR